MKALFVCLLSLLLLPPSDAWAQQIKMRAAMHGDIKHPVYGRGMVRLKEEVERRSEKTIIIEIFDRGQLLTDPQMIDGVSSGEVEIGTTAAQMFAAKAPAVGILSLPFLFNFKALSRAAASRDGELRKVIDDIVLAQAGVRVLAWQPLGDMVFFSKGQDVADVGQLKDMRVAVTGKPLADFVDGCGGRPSFISFLKMTDSIKEGTHDAALMTFSAFRNQEFWRSTDTLTYTAHARTEFFLIMSERTWQSLSPAHRAIMIEAARVVESEGNEQLAKSEALVEHLISEKGTKVVHLTPDNFADWRACTADMIADYMEKNGELAHRLMAAYSKLRTDPCCSAGPGDKVFTRR